MSNPKIPPLLHLSRNTPSRNESKGVDKANIQKDEK